jgi:DNA-binding MarR family transcriptional regulator
MSQFSTSLKILNLYRTHATIEAALEAALAGVGLSVPQWGTLRILREHPGASGADVARIACVSPQAVTTMLRRLEDAELIVRSSAPHGRVVETYLTPKGETVLEQGDRLADRIEAQVFADFSPEEQQMFNVLLLRCMDSLSSEAN